MGYLITVTWRLDENNYTLGCDSFILHDVNIPETFFKEVRNVWQQKDMYGL